MTDIENAYALFTQILDYLHRKYSLDELRQALAQRPRLLEMLRQLVDAEAVPVPTPEPSTLAPFRVMNNQILKDGVPFKFTGYNLREAAFYGTPQAPYTDINFLQHQLYWIKDELQGKVVRFYAAHQSYDVEQVIPRVINVLNMLEAKGLFAIVCLTDGVHSGYSIRDTDQNFRGRHTHEFYAGGYRQNYLPYIKRMCEAIADHGAILMIELGNEFLIPFPPFASQPTPAQYQNVLEFLKEAAAIIRTAIPTKMIGTGAVSAWEFFADHAYDGMKLGEQLYNDPNVDCASVHTYEGRRDHRWGDTGMHLEREMSIPGNHALYIGETGMNFGTEDGGWLARLGSETVHPTRIRGTSGLLQWALQASPTDRGIGDLQVGMNQFQSTMWHHYTGALRHLAQNVYR